MKKKIKYGSIPKKVLDIVVGEAYGCGDYTLKDELNGYGQDIIAYRYKLHEKGGFEFFHAWTKDYAMSLVHSLFGDMIILGLNRNPPEELIKK